MKSEAKPIYQAIGDRPYADLLLERIEAEFARAAKLIDSLDDEVYRDKGGRAGSIGSHVRHNLDLAACLFRDLEKGTVDYSARDRDERIETDRTYAIAAIKRISDTLGELAGIDGGSALRVRSEIDTSAFHASTLGRELEFLHSHTVHHHAIIAERLIQSGLEAGHGFGVAPSTLRFWNREATTTGS